MPFQPPTRPHSANPHAVLNPSIFPRPITPNQSSTSSTSSFTAQRPSQAHTRTVSHTGYGRLSKEQEWDDAWDSSSDKEDSADLDLDNRPSSSSTRLAKAVPIPHKSGSAMGKGAKIGTGGTGSEGSEGVVASWNSNSYTHINHPTLNTPSPPSIPRPQLQSIKTYNDATTAPTPGTGVLHESTGQSGNGTKGQGGGGGSKLPPGGSWEIVEEAELRDEVPKDLAKPGKEVVRSDFEEILNNPLQLLGSLHISAPSTPIAPHPHSSSNFPFLGPSTPITSSTPPHAPSTPESIARTSVPSRKEGVSRARSVRTERRREKFAKVLRGRVEDGGGVDLAELRRLAWSGVPNEVRPIAWQLLLNYLPLPTQPRLTTLSRKRKEYSQLVDQYFGRGPASLDQQIWHQVEIDVPRTRPGVPLWSCITAQKALERILYVWAIRHPASGYVQGINDLVCPFFQVFLSAYIDTDPELFDVAHLPPTALAAIEADSFWCLSKLLDGIQDNYISQQPGIQRLVKRMSELVKRIDAPLAAHFEDQGVEFMQFAFRWMNCLLMREISVKCTIRMWDTYLAEGTDAFSQFHLYVCSALLVKYSERLREMDFQEMIIFLQCLPTQSWNDHEIELLLSEAYVLKTVWQGAENHFANLPNGQQSGGPGSFGMLGR